MALPNPFRRLKASTSTLDELSAELGRLDRVRLDAQATLHELGAKRPSLLVDGTDTALAKFDAELATASRTLEQAEARIALITPEWQEADRRETEDREAMERRDRYAAAVKARAEGVKLIAEYEREAAAIAAKLRRLQAIEWEIDRANAELPDDEAPIGRAEPFNGTAGTKDHTPLITTWVSHDGRNFGAARPSDGVMAGIVKKVMPGYGAIPGVPGLSHRSLFDRVALPAADPNAASHWCGPLAAGPGLSADAAAVLRFHGVQL